MDGGLCFEESEFLVGRTEYESIKDFLERVDEKYVNDLYEKWSDICDELEIDLHYVRNEVDQWFQECYQSRKDVRKLNYDVSCEMADRRREELLDKFFQRMSSSAENCHDFVKKLNIQQHLDNIRNYQPGCWVSKAIECVEKENELMANFNKVKQEAENEESIRQVEQHEQHTRSICSTVAQKVSELCNSVNNHQQYEKDLEEENNNIQNLTLVISIKKETNIIAGLQKKLADMNSKAGKLQELMTQTASSIDQCIQEIDELLEEGLQKFKDLILILIQKVNDWRKEFQYDYAELEANPCLDRIAPWCAQVGKQLYDLLMETLPKFSNCLMSRPDMFNLDLDLRMAQYEILLHEFLQQTFVVTEQETYIIKVDKKHLPKIVVRILAADYFPSHAGGIEARFLYEDDINEQCLNKIANADTLENIKECARFENKKRNVTVCFTSPKRKKLSEGIFQSLQFKDKFVRPENNSGKQVHEEKYRILFTTTLMKRKLWTLSLPLVVTTGANQGCLCQASIMWQCFSTDVYKVPLERANELLWCDVASMLQAKIRKLSPNRILNDDNLAHLKKRLFGKENNSEVVTLKMFCFDKMVTGNDEESLNFSFWKWFIGVYNLIDRYLLNFWKENLIFGFISKESAKEKLVKLGSCHSGTFILRFSDHNITDSQGVKSVFSHLTATVLVIKEKEGRKKKFIYDFDVGGHGKLKNLNLAYLLMETVDKNCTKIYQYVYPGKRRREDTFDKHSKEETVVDGYNGIRDVFMVDLCQAMCALELDTGKHTRTFSTDSGIALSPSGSDTSAAPVKKICASVEQQHPTITKMLNNPSHPGPSISPAPSFQSSCCSSSVSYPPGSPNVQHDSPAPVSHSPPTMVSGLPTFINDINSQCSPGKYSNRSHGNGDKCNSNGRNNHGNGTKSNGAGQLDGCESAQTFSSLSEESRSLSPAEQNMEVTISDNEINLYQMNNSNDGFVYEVMKQGGELIMVKQQLSPTNQIAVSSISTMLANQTLEQQPVLTNQNTASAISSQELLLYLQAIVSKLPEEQRIGFWQQINTGANQVSESLECVPTQTIDENPISTMADVMFCSASNTIDTPALTSSGSISDAFNFSSGDIAGAKEIDSGNIDVTVFDNEMS
ncbi:T-helper 1 cell lineage commitment [Mactra antiquata]